MIFILIHSPRITARLLMAGLVIPLSACKKPVESAAYEQTRMVKVLELHNGGAAREVEFPGQIQAVRQTWKAFEVEGRITENPLKEGQAFKKGDILAQLDPSDFEATKKSAEARYETARITKQRLDRLFKSNAVSKAQYELSQRDLITAESDLNRAKKALADTKLVADFDGTVATVLVDEFANVEAKENVMLIVDTSSMEIAIHVPESMIAVPMPGGTEFERVKNAKPVVIPSAMPEQAFAATLAEASDTADPVTRTYEVTLSFTPPADLLILPGMTAKVRATIPANARNRTQGFPVPPSAVFSSADGQAQIWQVNNETLAVSAIPVEMGAIINGNMVVNGDLKGGEWIATSGIHQLHPGQQVRIWENP